MNRKNKGGVCVGWGVGSCSLTSVRTPTRPREAERNRTPRCVPMNRPPVRLLSRLLVNSCAFSSLSRSSQLNLKHSAIGGGGDGALAPVAYCQKWRCGPNLVCRCNVERVRHPFAALLFATLPLCCSSAVAGHRSGKRWVSTQRTERRKARRLRCEHPHVAFETGRRTPTQRGCTRPRPLRRHQRSPAGPLRAGLPV